MRSNHQGISLWYGTPDAPGPGETVQSGSEIPITIGVQPPDASNKVEVFYRINQGPTQSVAAKWWRNDAYGKAQYFRARLPTFRAGDTVEYVPTCYCAGRQVPSTEEVKRFASSFRVGGVEAGPTVTLAPKETLLPKLDILTDFGGTPIAAGRPTIQPAVPTTVAPISPQQLPQPTLSALPLRSAEAPQAQAQCPGVPGGLAQQRGCLTGGIEDSNQVKPQWANVEPYGLNAGFRAGAEAVEPVGFPVIAEGVVRTSFVSHEDFPFNHESHDQNFDVKLDQQYEYLLSVANHREENGECWIEAEWEIKYFPDQFWPAPGDRVWMMGRWVFDCEDPTKYTTEIHPPHAVAFTRREPTFFPGDWAPSLAIKTQVFIEGRGNSSVYTPMLDTPFFRDYEFDIDLLGLLPSPSPTAQFHAEVLERPYGGPPPIITPILHYTVNANSLIPPPPPPSGPRVHVRVPLAPAETRYVFSWDNIPGTDNDKLMRWVQQLGYYWLPRLPPTIEKIGTDLITFSFDLGGEPQQPIHIGLMLDSTRSFVAVRLPTFYHFFVARMESGYLHVYDYDQLPVRTPAQFTYGALIALGWREPITTQRFRVLRVTFDSVRINNSHHVNAIIDPPFNEPTEPAKWRLWVRAGSTWLEVAGLDNVRGGDTISINKTVLVVVTEDGALSLQTTGWVVGQIDNLLGQPFPDLASGLWEAWFGDLGRMPPKANQRIGIVSDQYTAAENFGIGPHPSPSKQNRNPGVGGDTKNDFVLYYHIDELARIPAGTPIRKLIWITFLNVRVRDTQDVNRTARISLDIRMVQNGIFGRASHTRSFDGVDIPLGSTVSLPQGWTINLPPLRYGDTMTLDILISDANKPFPDPPDTDGGPNKPPAVGSVGGFTINGPVPTEETFDIRLSLNQTNNFDHGQRTARSSMHREEFIDITYRIDVVDEPSVGGGGPPSA